jgi:nucleotide-binding universal stress UspA family protein
MRNIVIGYDDTNASRRALDRAADLARLFESRVVVVSVAAAVGTGPPGAGPLLARESPVRVDDDLRTAQARLQEHGIDADYVPAVGSPVDAILRVADDERADLIVVGTRDVGLLQRLLGRSVSGGVVYGSQADVLVVRADD